MLPDGGVTTRLPIGMMPEFEKLSASQKDAWMGAVMAPRTWTDAQKERWNRMSSELSARKDANEDSVEFCVTFAPFRGRPSMLS